MLRIDFEAPQDRDELRILRRSDDDLGRRQQAHECVCFGCGLTCPPGLAEFVQQQTATDDATGADEGTVQTVRCKLCVDGQRSCKSMDVITTLIAQRRSISKNGFHLTSF